MAADGGPPTGGPGLSLCLLLAARSSAGPSKPSRPLKAEKEKKGKSLCSSTVPPLQFLSSLISVKIRQNFTVNFESLSAVFTRLCSLCQQETAKLSSLTRADINWKLDELQN